MKVNDAPAVLDDKTKLPISWLFGLAAFGFGLLSSALLGAIAIGVIYSTLSLGQQTNSKAIEEIKTDRTARIREGEEFQKTVLSELAELKTDVKYMRGKIK